MWRPNNSAARTTTFHPNHQDYLQRFQTTNIPTKPNFRQDDQSLPQIHFFCPNKNSYKPHNYYQIPYCSNPNDWYQAYNKERLSLENVGKLTLVEFGGIVRH